MTKTNQKQAKTALAREKKNLATYEIDIRPLKTYVKSKESQFSNKAFCQTILAERDIISSEKFLAKLETWLNLLRLA